ncbi:T9SS type A sorting domain-containing protein [Maribacter algarum]|uniref:T9SS type A sorting domain-containing protein n=1 Tax=Maribacter algarum (ex Zhang et al. 2020) TaxID=2578118 RepID=A0A5S3PS97_9FLAO|nr:T9SS type A sorting domain-containing protein [Maribacter algarum]TMM57886.1 T9SS type A sorting domain-containing protein [Maribacter algarum]
MTKINLLSLGFFLCVIANCRAQELLRSTLSTSGFSKQLSEKDGAFLVQQSIGQSSVIGTSQVNGVEVRQGFIQSGLKVSKLIVTESDLDAVIYPNPIHSELNVKFNEDIDDNIFISIYDMMGRLVFIDEQKPQQEITLDLNALSSSTYAMRIVTGSKQFKVNIIKR